MEIFSCFSYNKKHVWHIQWNTILLPYDDMHITWGSNIQNRRYIHTLWTHWSAPAYSWPKQLGCLHKEILFPLDNTEPGRKCIGFCIGKVMDDAVEQGFTFLLKSGLHYQVVFLAVYPLNPCLRTVLYILWLHQLLWCTHKDIVGWLLFCGICPVKSVSPFPLQ